MKCLTNCEIYTGDEIISSKAIIINNNKIVDLVSLNNIPNEAEIIDLNGKCISAGFIDLQINGGGGVLFNNNISCQTIKTIKNAHMKYGVTGFLPTLITTSINDVKKAINVVREYIESEEGNVFGIHLEGPFINTKKPGVHNKAFIKEHPNLSIIKNILDGNTDIIKMMTIAPEVFDNNVLEYLFNSNICISVGHSEATFSELSNFLGKGIKCATHLFNAMTSVMGREPGVVGSVLEKRIYSSIIADGQHVHYSNISLVKGILKDKLFLVTDAMPTVGSSKTTFSIGEYNISFDGNKCITSDGTLAGSALNMAQAVKNCVEKVGIPLEEALRMASLYPAKVIGVDKQFGEIRPGYNADMVVFDKKLNIYSVISNGKINNYNSLNTF